MFKKKTGTGILSLLLLTAGLLLGKAGYALDFPGPLNASFVNPDIVGTSLLLSYDYKDGTANNLLTINQTGGTTGTFKEINGTSHTINGLTYTLSAVLDKNNNNQLISGALTITGGIGISGDPLYVPAGSTLLTANLTTLGTNYISGLPSSGKGTNSGTFQFLGNVTSSYPGLGFAPQLVVTFGANGTILPEFQAEGDFTGTGSADNNTPVDYGDAPDTGSGTGTGNYNTIDTDNGPYHVIGYPVYLGSVAPDADSGALQNAGATADDATGVVPPDEDGIPVLPKIPANSSAPVSMTVNATNDTENDAILACWIDFNRNGVFEATERATTTVPANPPPNPTATNPYTLTFSGFGTTGTGTTYIRCRITTDWQNATQATPVGGASNGEVEDYGVSMPAADYGDAPDTGSGTGTGNYNTTTADNGPSHLIVTTPQVYLGSVPPDVDSGYLQDVNAAADDLTGVTPSDEDGLKIMPSIATVSTSVTVKYSATNLSAIPALLACWIDFNRNGVFTDAGERATVTVPAGTAVGTPFNLTFTGFQTPLTLGDTYLRCRISTDPTWTANPIPTGGASNGEIEDFKVPILEQCAPRTITAIKNGSNQTTGYTFSNVRLTDSSPIACFQCTSWTNLNLGTDIPPITNPPEIAFTPTPSGVEKFTEWGPTWCWNNGPTFIGFTVNKVNPASGTALISCNITNESGQTCTFDPVFTTVSRLPKAKKGDDPNMDVTEDQSLSDTWTPQDDYLTVKNGDPGIKELEVTVNKTKFKLSKLTPNEERSICLNSAIVAGGNNTLKLKAKGKPGGQADVEIMPSDGLCGP